MSNQASNTWNDLIYLHQYLSSIADPSDAMKQTKEKLEEHILKVASNFQIITQTIS